MEIKVLELNDGQGDNYSNSWFSVDGEIWGVSVPQSDDIPRLLDCDGCPVEPCNDHDSVLNALLAYVDSHRLHLGVSK